MGSPRPKSPPQLYGKRRELAKVLMLEREICFLEEELKSVEKLQPASFCIKEVADYVVTNPEPLITVCKKTRKSCRFWKWLCGNSCFNISCLCCCCTDCSVVKPPCCCCCCSLPKCCSCSLPKCGWPSCLSAKACSCCPGSSCCPKCLDCKCCWPTKCSFPKCFSCGCCSLPKSCCSSNCECCC